MAREPIPTWCFAVCIVRLGRRVLLVQEQKHGNLWYLPAGRVEPGETFAEGACRETLEEAGIPIVLEGIVRIEHTPHPTGSARTRVMFVARPADDTPPKTVADEHSVRAGWFDLDELTRLPLRGTEVRALAEHVLNGGAVYPLELLVDETVAIRSPPRR